MTISTALRRIVAIAAGGIIMAATAHAVITITGQEHAHATLTWTLAGGLFVGACIVGTAWGEKRHALAVLLIGAIVAGEAGNAGLSIDALVVKRDRDASHIRSALGAHNHALAEMTKAQAAFDAANRAVIEKAALRDCRANCRSLLDTQVATAKHDLDAARTVYSANPKPSASASALADRVGVPAWVVDVALAVLLAIGGNGLAALLVAYGAHGSPRAHSFPNPDTLTPAEIEDARRALRPVTNCTNISDSSPATITPNRSPNGSGTDAITAYILTEIALGRSIPSQQRIAERFGAAKSTVSDLLADLELSGMIARHREGRRMVISAPR